MPLSPSTIKELTTELETLERKRREVDERINAITLLLRPGRVPRRSPAAEEPVQPVNASGLRGALRTALARGAMAPGDVIKALYESGFKTTGKTPINMRVYNELARMKKDGLTKKDSEGRYALAS